MVLWLLLLLLLTGLAVKTYRAQHPDGTGTPPQPEQPQPPHSATASNTTYAHAEL